MNDRPDHGRRGAALMIALLAALVVMLAAALLLNITESMVRSHDSRLMEAQVALSEASGADYVRFLLENSGPGAADPLITHELADVNTCFTLIGSSQADIRSGLFPLNDPYGTLAVPTGNGLMTACAGEDDQVTVAFYDDETFQISCEFTIGTSMRPVAGTSFTLDGEQAVMMVLSGNGETMICAVTPMGVRASCVFPETPVESDSYLSACVSSQGEPLLLATDGANTGTLFDLADGSRSIVRSPYGTCPVVLPDGSVFGSFSDENPILSIVHVKDVLWGDFNSDGIEDLAFASSFGLSAWSGATGELYVKAPGGVLVCWGEIRGRTGLVGMWTTPSGEDRWFRLGWNGFQEFVPEASFRLGWEGRFTGNGSTLAGVIHGSAVLASASGSLREFFSGRVSQADIDGGDLDFLLLNDDGLEVVFNPLNGSGIEYTYLATNTCRGKDYPGNTHSFRVYDAGSSYRVFHSLGGGAE